jgi:isopentenyldiphosphate isomerase
MSKVELSDADQAAYKKAAGEEVIEIVDVDNNVLEPKKRSVMRAEGLIHRATYALVKDSQNYFYVQKRSMLKDYCPGYFDPTPGGVVGAGESYEDTNRREVEEEMGIPETAPMVHLFDFYYEDQRIKCWGDCWEITYDGPLRLQQTEVDAVEKMSMQEILDRFEAGESFTPDSIAACREYVKRRGCPVITGDGAPAMPHIEFY